MGRKLEQTKTTGVLHTKLMLQEANTATYKAPIFKGEDEIDKLYKGESYD